MRVLCQSSRLVGATSHSRTFAWTQYSRLMPPGCGWGVPKTRSSTGWSCGRAGRARHLARRARRPCGRRRDRRAGPPCRRACTAALRHRCGEAEERSSGRRCGRASGWSCRLRTPRQEPAASIGGVSAYDTRDRAGHAGVEHADERDHSGLARREGEARALLPSSRSRSARPAVAVAVCATASRLTNVICSPMLRATVAGENWLALRSTTSAGGGRGRALDAAPAASVPRRRSGGERRRRAARASGRVMCGAAVLGSWPVTVRRALAFPPRVFSARGGACVRSCS